MNKSLSKSTAMLLCLLILISCFPAFSSAAQGGSIPGCGVMWSYSGGTLTLSGSGVMPSLYEPAWSDYCESIKKIAIGSGVTAVDVQTLAASTSVQSYVVNSTSSFITVDGVLFSADKKTLVAYPTYKTDAAYSIPAGVTAIGKESFHSIKYLKNLTFADSVTQIREEAFYGSKKLQSLTLNPAVKTIGQYAFSYSALKNIELSSELLTVENNAFYSCNSLLSIDIPSKVTLVGRQAFQQCVSLQTVSIPSTVTQIGYEAFDDNYELVSITVDSGNQNYCSVDGVLYDKAKATLLKFPASKTTGSFTVPDGVIRVDEQAFEYGKLSDVVLPESVVEIGEYAFSSCMALEKLALPSMLNTVGDGAFNSCEALKTIVIRAAAKSLNFDFLNCFENMTAFEVEDGNAYFSEADGVLFNAEGTLLLKYPKYKEGTEYTVPDNVVKISEQAFSDSSLESVRLNLKLQEIGDCAFYPCQNLKSITVPVSVTTIGKGAIGFSRISDRGNKVNAAFVIVGAADSVAESYARDNGITFSACAHALSQEMVIDATCTVGGYTSCVCTDCGKRFKKNKLAALAHDLVRDTVRDKAATCDKAGVEAYTCSRCNAGCDKTVAACGHDFKHDVARDKKATCYNKGVEAYTCSRCNAKDDKITTRLSHTTVADKAVAATCTKSGLTAGSHCSRCGTVIVTQFKTKTLPHTDADENLLCDSCGICLIGSKAVTGLQAVLSTSATVKLKWNKLSGASYYKIYRYNPEKKSYEYYKTTSSTTFTDKGLESNKAFYYKVRACKTIKNNECASALSDRVKIFTAPSKATEIKAVGYDTTSVKLTWKKQTSVSGYVIYKYNASTKKWELCKTVKGNVPLCSVTKLKSGTAYKLRVKAYRTVGGKNYYGDDSASLTVSTKSCAPVLKGAVSVKSAKLSWSKVKGASSYSVYMYDAATKAYKRVGKTTSPEFTTNKLVCGKSYCFKIKAYNRISGYSGYSNTVKIRVK